MYQRILVPYDGSPISICGLNEAIQLARLTSGRLRLIHLLNDLAFAGGFDTGVVYSAEIVPAIREAGVRLLKEASLRLERESVPCETCLIENESRRLAEVVMGDAQAWKADLIVIGTHGRRGVGRMLLGSDAEQVVRLATVPVLLVRASR